MEESETGFREIAHTADWELEVWAPDLPALLKQAALGMYALSGTQLQDGPRERRELKFAAADPEGLLVSFLEELRFLSEVERVGFDLFDLSLEGQWLLAGLEGGRLSRLAKEIKAVTYHRLKIERGPRGLVARVIFDV